MMPIPLPSGSSPGPSRAPLPAHHLMRVILTAIIRSGMRGLSSRLYTGLHLAQFRHKHRPLAKVAVDYAELFIYDEAQQEAALSDIAILGALPRKCLLLRLGDPRQNCGGTGPGRLAQEVRAVSDDLALGIRSQRHPFLPQELPRLVQDLLIDDLPSRPEHPAPLLHTSLDSEGGLPSGSSLWPQQPACQCGAVWHPPRLDACRHCR